MSIEELNERTKQELLKLTRAYNELAMEALTLDPPEPNRMQGLQQISMMFANTFSQLNSLTKTYEAFFIEKTEESKEVQS